MLKQQRGFSVFSTLFIVLVLGGVLLLLFKLLPVYTEYVEVKNTIRDIAKDQRLTEAEVRRQFDLRAHVADITSISAKELVVVSGSNFLFVRAKYRREVPLVANVSLAFDFDTSAGQNPATQSQS